MDHEPLRRPRIRSLLPDPFWWSLFALLSLSILSAVPIFAVCAAIWPSAKGSHAGIFFAVAYLIALPITWSLFRSTPKR